MANQISNREKALWEHQDNTANSHCKLTNMDKKKYFSSAPLLPRPKKICRRKREGSEDSESNRSIINGALLPTPSVKVKQAVSSINVVSKHISPTSDSVTCIARTCTSRSQVPSQILLPYRTNGSHVKLKALYHQEGTTQDTVSTALETVHEEHDIIVGHKHRRFTVFNPYEASKLKLKHRRGRARILRKQGVTVPTGNMFSYQEVMLALANIDDNHDSL